MDKLNIHPRILTAARNAKLTSYVTVLSMSAPDIERATSLSLADVAMLQQAVAEAIPISPPTTGLKLLETNQRRRLSTGCTIIDDFLEGGILQTGITEICGESACGKTQLCMQLCLTVQLPKTMGGLGSGALYICTEDVFPNKRLHQMASHFRDAYDRPEVKSLAVMDNIFIEHAADLDDLRFCIMQKVPILLSRGAARLIIVDSIAALFRCEFGAQDAISRAKEISAFGMQLHRLSHKFSVAVVCINQVSAVINDQGDGSATQGKKIKPSLGLFWANLVTTRIMLSRDGAHYTAPGGEQHPEGGSDQSLPLRTLEVAFAPHLPNSKCSFIVSSKGVRGLR